MNGRIWPDVVNIDSKHIFKKLSEKQSMFKMWDPKSVKLISHEGQIRTEVH